MNRYFKEKTNLLNYFQISRLHSTQPIDAFSVFSIQNILMQFLVRFQSSELWPFPCPLAEQCVTGARSEGQCPDDGLLGNKKAAT